MKVKGCSYRQEAKSQHAKRIDVLVWKHGYLSCRPRGALVLLGPGTPTNNFPHYNTLPAD